MTTRTKQPREDDLRRLYVEERMSTRALGEHYGVSHMSIKRWLRELEIPRRSTDRGLSNRGIVAPTADELRRMVHQDHLSYRDIAEMYGVDHSAVPHWLTKHGIAKPTVWGTRRRGPEPVLPGADELASRYAAGESLEQIAKNVGVGRRMIGDLCRRYGIEVQPDGWQGGRRWDCADGHQVRSSYEQQVDDWLHLRGLAHELEPRLPFDRRFRADFLVGGCYIEVWGVKGSATYDARKAAKAQLYRERGLKLVELPAWTFATKKNLLWQRRLSAALLEGI